MARGFILQNPKVQFEYIEPRDEEKNMAATKLLKAELAIAPEDEKAAI